VYNNPLRYTDPSGHEFKDSQIQDYLRERYGGDWILYWEAWLTDPYFLDTIRSADYGYSLAAPSVGLKSGIFVKRGSTFSFEGGDLADYQGKGPYILNDEMGSNVDTLAARLDNPLKDGPLSAGLFTSIQTLTIFHREITQPMFDYSSGTPQFANNYRVISYQRSIYKLTLSKGTGISYAASRLLKKLLIPIPPQISLLLAVNQAVRVRDELRVNTVNVPAKSEYGPDGELQPVPYRSTWAHPCGPANSLQHGCP
jgi:hypothetical protein